MNNFIALYPLYHLLDTQIQNEINKIKQQYMNIEYISVYKYINRA